MSLNLSILQKTVWNKKKQDWENTRNEKENHSHPDQHPKVSTPNCETTNLSQIITSGGFWRP